MLPLEKMNYQSEFGGKIDYEKELAIVLTMICMFGLVGCTISESKTNDV
jgi:hypothetical protein